ncbi:MAG: prolyl oligopeptidase family serine peptidase [Bdellovibrionales bacterium]
MLQSKFLILLLAISTTACATSRATDPYIWLEDSKNPQVTPWVQTHNAKSIKQLEGDTRATEVAAEIRKIITADDRIPMPSMQGGMIRNFWQDKQHVRGVWRQTTPAEYAKAKPKWDILIDIDALNKAEGKSWVYKGANCLPPEQDLCLIQLSDGGRDESVIREFQVSKKSFVKNGFAVPAAKTTIDWYDKDTVLIGTDFGAGSLTDSGYPRILKVWKRGEPLAVAKTVFEGKKADVEMSVSVSIRPESKRAFLLESLTFFTQKVFLYEPGQPLKLLPFPESANFEGNFKEFIFATLRDDWNLGAKTFKRGSLVAIPADRVGQPDVLDHVEAVYTPDDTSALLQAGFSRDFIILTTMHNVLGELEQISRVNGEWKSTKLKFPKFGTLSVVSWDTFDKQGRFYAVYSAYTSPTTLYAVDGKIPKIVKTLPAKYDASDVITEQFYSTSKDGTKIPYFVVHKKSMALNGGNPTLMYGYGGFEISETPFYLGATGKVWLEKGGVYVVANIRGGGEYGPRWHEAALKENRQRAYDDFASVAQDLFARKITSPRRLGIMGGSNGGLLVGVAVTEHPEFYNAVVCESALLDMIRYTKLPPGASWAGEYGDPDDPKMAAVIEKYSPYQNIHANAHYPRIFFHISTADDRVQPGHTRKMTARLEENGADVLFYENTEGGHGGAADLEQRVKKSTLENIYLYQQLMD